MKDRVEVLDSMRGLAALSVVIAHLMLITKVFDTNTWNNSNDKWINVIKYTPLHVFWAGDEAVIFFFVLSGFVLSLPFYGRRPSYTEFIIRRICRIYIPYIVAVTLALIATRMFGGVVHGTSSWFKQIWSIPLTRQVILQHILLIGSLKVNALDPPIWSLAQEMRVSLIFPLLMLMVVRLRWIWSMLLGLAVALLSFRHGLYTPSGTFNYVLFFIMGALLAKHRLTLTAMFAEIHMKWRGVWVTVALFLYTFHWWTYGFLNSAPVIDYWVVALGVCIFIIVALSSPSSKKLLSFSPIHFVGKVSYSLYLLHMIVVATVVHELLGKQPIEIVYGVSLVLSLMLASVSYYGIELPSIRLGKYLSGLMKRGKSSRDVLGKHSVGSSNEMKVSYNNSK